MKRKKYPRLKNGFGSIRYLGKGRSNPYAVLAPTKKVDHKGRPKYEKPLTYVPDWNTGFNVLLMYHAKKWHDEADIESFIPQDMSQPLVNQIVNRIMSKLTLGNKSLSTGLTFEQVYERFYDWKFNQTKREFSLSSLNAYRAAFGNCKDLHSEVFAELKLKDLQDAVDNCTLKHASKELIVLLIKQM